MLYLNALEILMYLSIKHHSNNANEKANVFVLALSKMPIFLEYHDISILDIFTSCAFWIMSFSIHANGFFKFHDYIYVLCHFEKKLMYCIECEKHLMRMRALTLD